MSLATGGGNTSLCNEHDRHVSGLDADAGPVVPCVGNLRRPKDADIRRITFERADALPPSAPDAASAGGRCERAEERRAIAAQVPIALPPGAA